MKHTLRTVLGVFLLVMSVIGGLLPILQGWMFFAAAIAVLGTDHAIVRWGVRKFERFPWARKLMDKVGLRKPAEGDPPAAST